MEALMIVCFSFLCIVFNSLKYSAELVHTPQNHIFLGTAHSPLDYFYYLSQFAQGSERFLTSYNLYTGEFKQATYIGWVNVLLGRIFHTIGISHIPAYAISVFLLSALYCYISYNVIQRCYPSVKEKHARIMAFFLAGINNAVPYIYNDASSGYTWSLFSFWYNTAIPYIRLGWVPHHMVATIAILVLMLLYHAWNTNLKKQYEIGYIVGYVILSIILASLNPVQWAVLGSSFSIVLVLRLVSNVITQEKGSRSTQWFTSLLSSVLRDGLPLLFMFIGGLIVVLYYRDVFSVPPYMQLADWEKSHQVKISFWTFLPAYGPVFIIALASIVPYTQRISRPIHLTIFVYACMSIALFFSPIPRIAGLHNIRFLSSVLPLFFAIIATRGITALRLATHKASARLYTGIVVCITLFLIPTYAQQIQERVAYSASNDVVVYLPDNVLDTFTYARRISSPDETFLVTWPFNMPFPGVTGRRVFHGHELLTIDYVNKDTTAYQFFSNQLAREVMQQFLVEYDISYLLLYSWQVPNYLFRTSTVVYDNGYLAIIKVEM